MRRRFTDRVEIWDAVATPDGFGGNTLAESMVKSAWAKISTINQDKLMDYGLDATKYAVNLRMRTVSGVDLESKGIFFKFKARRWAVQSVRDEDLDGKYMSLVLVNTK